MITIITTITTIAFHITALSQKIGKPYTFNAYVLYTVVEV
mgnify:CR=1 FL=1